MRTKIFTVISVVGIILVLLLNLGLGVLGREGQLFVDMTPEKFYSLSANMKDTCRDILDTPDASGKKKEIEIIFCADPDTLMGTTALRPTYFMALQLRNMFDNVTVRCENINVNPAAVSMYRTTSRRNINYTDMIVSYKNKDTSTMTYRITDVTTFWTDDAFSYNGEYRMVSILASITALDAPVAYFVSDYGTTYYDPEFPDSDMSISMAAAAELIEERGLVIKTIKLSELGDDEGIPEDCALLIINNPTEDMKADESKLNSFKYQSVTEKLDRYLASHAGAIIVNKDYAVSLPEFEAFLTEWGIGFGDGVVKDEESYVPGEGETGSAILGVYDANSFGSAYYGDYASLASSPKMIFTNTGYVYNTYAPDEEMMEPGNSNTLRTYANFITTTDKAIEYEALGSTTMLGEAGTKALAAASVRTYLDRITGETVYSYLFCTNTKDFFSNDIIGNKAYANYGIMASVISSISRIDRYASMSLGGLSPNSPSYGGKQTVSTELTTSRTEVWSADAKEIIAVNNAFGGPLQVAFIILISIPPLVALVFGIVLFVKRKHL